MSKVEIATRDRWPLVSSLPESILKKLVSFTRLEDRYFLVVKEAISANPEDPDTVNVLVLGHDPHGFLGLGPDVTQVDEPTKIEPLAKKNIVKMVAGGCDKERTHILALDQHGRLWAWGCNKEAQLAIVDVKILYTPTKIDRIGKGHAIVDIAAGRYHCLALDDQGAMRAWGWNGYGQLGLGHSTKQTEPARITTSFDGTALPAVERIAAGGNRSMALLAHGRRVFVWGDGEFGSRPREVEFDSRVQDIGVIYTSSNSISMFLTCDGEIFQSVDADGSTTGTTWEQITANDNEHTKFVSLHTSSNGSLCVAVSKQQNVYKFVVKPSNVRALLSPNDKLPSDAFAPSTKANDGDEDDSSASINNVPFMLTFEGYEERLESKHKLEAEAAFDSEEDHDFFFVVDKKIIYAQRDILVANSEHMKNLLEELSSYQSNSVENHSYETFRAYLYYLYTSKLDDLSLREAMDMILLAVEYDEMPLRQRCIEIIAKAMTMETIAEIYQLAKVYELHGLDFECNKWLLAHFKEIVDTNIFTEAIDPNDRSILMVQYYSEHQDEA